MTDESTDPLRQMLADFELLNGIAEGAISPAELANRATFLGTGDEVLVVPRGYFKDEMMRAKTGDENATVGEVAWEEEEESDEYLAQMKETAVRYNIPEPPPPEPVHVEEPPPPGSADDESHPPEDEKPDSMLAKVRRAIGRS